MRTTLFVLSVLASIGGALAADNIKGDELRSTIAGKTIHVATPAGTVPVNFRGDGTMLGRSTGLAAYAMSATDRGRWWIADDRLCQQWDNWLRSATHCVEMRRAGKTLYWKGSGRSGVATIAN